MKYNKLDLPTLRNKKNLLKKKPSLEQIFKSNLLNEFLYSWEFLSKLKCKTEDMAVLCSGGQGGKTLVTHCF